MSREMWIKECYIVARAVMQKLGFKLEDVVVDDTRQIVDVGEFHARGDEALFLCALCPDDIDDRIYMIYWLDSAGSFEDSGRIRNI